MRKRLFWAAFAAVVNVAMAMAQQIAVVSDGTTTMYQTLKDAITGAPGGSVIYLPGGGFQIADDVKITKKLTIIGIGHKPNGGSADGNTVISGNLFFDGGSDHSAVMGCYISGDVNIGNDGSSVNNIAVRHCNLNSMQVRNATCTGIIVNQNYIRAGSNYGNSTDNTISNNVMSELRSFSGVLSNNIMMHGNGATWSYYIQATNSTITNNFILSAPYYNVSGSVVVNNMASRCPVGEGCIYDSANNNKEFDEFFVGWYGISPASDFHFKGEYKQYENTIGIYAGDGFDDSGMAPVPYIMAKKVAEQTDASGMLNVKIRVKAGE